MTPRIQKSKSTVHTLQMLLLTTNKILKTEHFEGIKHKS